MKTHLHIVFFAGLLCASGASATKLPNLHCAMRIADEVTNDFCFVQDAPTDSHGGLALKVGEDGRLTIAPGRYHFVDAATKKDYLFLVDITGLYQPFKTRTQLPDGRIIEFYELDLTQPPLAYYVFETKSRYPLAGAKDGELTAEYLPEGSYTLSNGKIMTVGKYETNFPEWNQEGLPDYLFPAIPETAKPYQVIQ